MKCTSLPIGLVVFAGITAIPLPLRAQILFSEDFETGQTVGNQPTGATSVKPNPNTATSSVTIVNGTSNPAGGGTGNGVRIYDDDANAAGLEYNFVANSVSQVSALRVDLTFTMLSIPATALDQHIFFSAGEYNSTTNLRFNASARRPFEVRFSDDGLVDFVSGGSADTNNAILAGQNLLSVFINDYDSQSIDYTRPDNSLQQSLAANSIAFWLNSALMATYSLDLSDTTAGGTFGNTENNFGRFGLATNTGSVDLEWNFDNFTVTSIPEPSTIGLLASGVILLIARRARGRSQVR
jgi:hypothetical protein